jgi:thiosulfate/3-mercaptopyruvate sulfurtransferase
MNYKNPNALVSTDWLSANIDDPNISIVDASFYLPTANRDPKNEFLICHIPKAVFFDINEIADQSTDLPHMLPSPNQFSKHMSHIGISNSQHVICYDTNGGAMASMRAWWTFRVFGHDRVSVLNGGLPKWQNEGLATSSQQTTMPKTTFIAKYKKHLVKNIEEIIRNVKTQKYQVIDARSQGRYYGKEPEPRIGLRSGHIPAAINLPFENLFDTTNFKTLRSADEILAIIKEAGIDPKKPIVSSCGSGVTAAPLVLALYLLGYSEAAIYDGSWTEWAARSDTPIDI